MTSPDPVLRAVCRRRPLVHCITNAVTMARVADALAAVGARPVMAGDPLEVAEMVEHADALLLNLGTPSPTRFAAAGAAGLRARARELPIVLDPVGCGTTSWRTEQLRALFHYVRPSIVRGNPPELAALANIEAAGWVQHGVSAEPLASTAIQTELAQRVSQLLGCVAVATGPADVIADGASAIVSDERAKALDGVVGAGDVLSALIGAACTVEPEPARAAAGMLAAFKLAAQRAGSRGGGAFWVRLLDTLGTLSEHPVDHVQRVWPDAMTEWNPDRLVAALRLYLLADTGLVPPSDLVSCAARAIQGGVTAIQLRAKDATTLEYLELARALRSLCTAEGVPLIVNDRVDVALAAEADGVHVGHRGEEDMTPKDARRLLGPDAIVGVSVGSAQEARLATSDGASYVSAGPMFQTTTKSNAGPAAGEPLLRSVRSATRLPLVVIGGITAPRAGALYAAGADGLCVGAAILRSDDPEAAARAFAVART
jgi:thiamine-phosphate diphosphorylase/hydroxyethylthiazole kinase